MKITSPISKLATFTTIVCFFTAMSLFIHACRKIDTPGKSPVVDIKAITEHFFTLPATTNEKVEAVAQFLSRENNKKEFVSKAVKNAGYPVWDKAIIATNSGVQHRSGTDNDDSTAIVYIPFVLEQTLTTSAILVVEIGTADTIYNTIWPQNYLQLGFDTTAVGWNSRQLFQLFTEFDYGIFNHTRFVVPDGRIFGADVTDTLLVTRLESNEGGRQLSENRGNVIEITLCFTYRMESTNWGIARSGTYGNPLLMTVCGIFYWSPDGGGSTLPSPVPPGVTWEQPPPPSEASGGGVWYPADQSIFGQEVPIDTATIPGFLKSVYEKNVTMADSLFSQALSDSLERTFSYASFDGTDTIGVSPKVGGENWSQPTISFTTKGINHTHQDDGPTDVYKNQSFDAPDIFKLYYQLLINKPVSFSIITTRDYLYAAVIVDPAKFKEYVRTITGSTILKDIDYYLDSIFTSAMQGCNACSWQKLSELGTLGITANNNSQISGIKIYKSTRSNINFTELTP